ncbi:MAG: glycosyltransferase family 39 protein [Neomegalonema sp.]|nr:glycosyltransferase family 39 protein [Neomegalonema sp.]
MSSNPPAAGPTRKTGKVSPTQAGGAFLARIAQAAPFAIIAYILALATLRLYFSDFLQVDEAAFVGQVGLQLVYDHARPPLFNWLTRLFLELTGWDWALSLAIVRLGALAAFHWFTFDTARRIAGPRIALLALAVSAFLPQIVWMSAIGLARTTLAMAFAAAALNALVRLFEDPSLKRWAIFGALAAFGMLSHFSFVLFLAPVLISVLLEPELAYAFRNRKHMAVGAGVFALICAPVGVAGIVSLWSGAGLASTLFARSNSWLSAVDVNYVGVDGFITLIISIIAWVAPAALLWTGARAYDRTIGPLVGPAHAFAQVMARAIIIGLAALALMTLLLDVHRVQERHLSPLFSFLPIYLAIAWPLRWSSAAVAAAAGAIYLLTLPAFSLMVLFDGKQRFAVPYERVAAQILRQTEGRILPILSDRRDDKANLTLALKGQAATRSTYERAAESNQVVLVWRGRTTPPPRIIPENFGAAARIFTIVAPLTNSSGAEMVYRFQLFEKLPAGAELVKAPPPKAPAKTADAAVKVKTEPTPRNPSGAPRVPPAFLEPRPKPGLTALHAGNLPPVE